MANAVNRYFEGLLVGGTLGFVIGLLTAPKPGAELRRELADSADDLLKNANTNLYDLKDRMSDRVAPIADKADVYRERMKEQFRERTDGLKEKASELKEKAMELKNRATKLGGSQESTAKDSDLLNNYMGNNSGPMYTAGAKASPEASATPVSDACSNYSAGTAEGGAAGG